MTSGDDPRTGLRLTRRVTVAPDEPGYRLDLRATNVSARPVRWALWNVTQRRAGSAGTGGVDVGVGLAPAGGAVADVVPVVAGTGVPRHEAPTRDRVHVPHQDVVGKVGFPTATGWLAHAYDGVRCTLRFDPDPTATYPDGGSRAEVWMEHPLAAPLADLGDLDPPDRIVEVEVLGPLVDLEPGASTDLTVRFDHAAHAADLQGGLVTRTAVVTGAARGIGAATAVRLAEDGYAVALLDVDPLGAEVAGKIVAAGHRAEFVRGDVSSAADWQHLVEHVHTTLGPVDTLVSNALLTVPKPLHELTVQEWERQLGVNLTGAFHGVRACLPDLRRDGAGTVVIVSSVHAWFGLPGVPGYAASKAGLTGLTRQLAVEYAGEVRVNCVLPGPVLTAQWDRISEADRAQSAGETVMGRLGRPEEVAAAISFLAGPDASFVTGASLAVDGGWSVTKDSS